jgi:two-component system response regulator AtoC
MSRRVLVVDDDPAMVTTLCDLLAISGWETLRGRDGQEATERAAAEGVDLVLMDVVMPRMNGVEALRAIKSQRPSTRVILMTAYAAEDLLLEAERAGVDKILRKPVELPNLLAALDAASAT